MPVCAYQGVMPLTMFAAGYSIPALGTLNPSTGISPLNAIDSWCVNGANQFGGKDFYINTGWSLLAGLKAGSFPVVGPDLLDFYIFKLTPTGFYTVHFQGDAIVAFDFTSNPALTFVGSNLIVLTKANSALNPILQGAFDVSAPTTYASPSTTNSFSMSGGNNPGNQIQHEGSVITLAGLVGAAYGTPSQTANVLDYFFTDWTTNPTAYLNMTNQLLWGSSISPGGIFNFNPISKVNYWVNMDLSAAPTGFWVLPFALTDFQNPIFGTQQQYTFSDDPTTGIINGTGMILRPFVGGWLSQGLVLADSQWYFINHDFSMYWNLSFSSGPLGNDVNNDIAPFRDQAGNWYTIDITTGDVFTSFHASPVFVPPVRVDPTIPFALPQCYSGTKIKLPKGRC